MSQVEGDKRKHRPLVTSGGNSTGFRDLSLSRFVFPGRINSNGIFSQLVSRGVNEGPDGNSTEILLIE